MTERISELQKHLQDNEAMLITSHPNRFYFTGFRSSAGTVFITHSAAVFLIDFRYYERAKAVVDGCEVVLSQHVYEEVLNLAKKHGTERLYVETDSVSVRQLSVWQQALTGVKIQMTDRMDRLIETMRSIKSRKELENIRIAQAMTDETFSYILNNIQPGRTEREIMLDMEFYIRRLGSEGVSFDFIVVSGKNSSLPHGVPTDKAIEPGDFVTMDFGAVVNGYRSDMTRTVAVGYVTDEQKRVYETVKSAQLVALSAIRAGAVCRDIDKIARDRIDSAGYWGCFGHGLGHSVGIEIHENPCLNTRCETVLKPGMIMTVEPGIYLENAFGVRIEDMVSVTADGCHNLTKSDKELIVL